MSAARSVRPLQMAVILVSGTRLGTLGHLIDPFTLTNELSGRTAYVVKLYHLGRQRPRVLGLAGSLDSEPLPDDWSGINWIWLVGDEPLGPSGAAALPPLSGGHLSVPRSVRLIGGVGEGVWYLAASGLLNGRQAAVHWSAYDTFIQTFPDVLANQRIFDMEGDRATVAGGAAATDLALQLIQQRQGATVAGQVAAHLLCAVPRSSSDLQPMPALSLDARMQPRLMEALHLMETNLAEPLGTAEIGRLVGVSQRQIERLFRRYLGAGPGHYYLDLRMRAARDALRRTARSVTEVAQAHGFASAAHFSYAYRRHFGVQPSADRYASGRNGAR